HSPGILEALVDLEGYPGVGFGRVVLVRVEGDHREEPLAGRFAPRVLHLAEARARREGSSPSAGEIEGAMIGMTERHVALRDAEAIPDPIELGAGLGEQTATALEPADGLFDEREQDQALC